MMERDSPTHNTGNPSHVSSLARRDDRQTIMNTRSDLVRFANEVLHTNIDELPVTW